MDNIDNIILRINNQMQLLYQEICKDDIEIQRIFEENFTQPTISNLETDKNAALIWVNNSFLHRKEIKTTKSDQYLGFIKSQDKGKFTPVVISSDLQMKKDWFCIEPKSKIYPEIHDLRDMAQQQLDKLGLLIFILISVFQESQIVTREISIRGHTKMLLTDNIDQILIVEGSSIMINPGYQDYEIWDSFSKQIKIEPDDEESVRKQFFQVVDDARKDYILSLRIPDSKDNLEDTLLDRIIEPLRKEIANYNESLSKWESNPSDESNYFNILRIAYNFADDANKLIRLIISVSDLKPIVFWLTIYSQFRLKNSFKNIDCQRDNKPSLTEYSNLIKGARNYRFHNILDIRNTLEVDLSNVSLKAKSLQFFTEYKPRRNQSLQNFKYEDQQLIEIITEFNRASVKEVSQIFWEQNLEIMNSTLKLLIDFNDALKTMRLIR